MHLGHAPAYDIYKTHQHILTHMIIIGGSASTKLAKEIAYELGCDYIKAGTIRFPDGECYTRLDTESLDDDVAIVQNTYPDGNLVELLLIQDVAKRMGAKSITVVIPYFGYARQDRVFKPGEPESAKVMCEIIGLKADRVITVDLHKEDTLGYFKCKTKDVKAAEAIADYFREKGIDLVMSPDIGAAGRAKDVGTRLGVEYDHLNKTRLSGTEVQIKPANADCRGKNVLIVDDMIATGGTIIAANQQLKEAGAKSVSVACTHGVFVNNAIQRLMGSSLDGIFCCNTLENEVSKISVAKSIAKALRE